MNSSHHYQLHGTGVRPTPVLNGSAGQYLSLIPPPSGTENHALQATRDEPPRTVAFNFLYNAEARPGEEHGRAYYFVGEQTFQEMVARNEFVEWSTCMDISQDAVKSLTEKIDQGIDVLLEIDVQGAMQVKKRFEDSVLIFILPPSMTELRARLQTRASDTPEEIQRRLHKVKEEVWSYREYAYVVRNEDLSRSLRDLESIFWSERLRTKRLNMTWLENNFIIDDEQKP
jgi:guanylate kinase